MRIPFFLILVVISLKVYAQGGIGAGPAKIYFEGSPGQVVFQEITLANPTNLPVDLITYFADWKRDSMGDKTYHKPGSLEKSCYEWLSIQPQSIHLEAGEIKTAKLSIQIPDDTDKLQHVRNTMLFFKQNKITTQAEFNQEGLQSQIDVFFQIGLHVYFTPPGLHHKEITLRNLKKLDQNHLQLALENTGDVELNAGIKLELTNKSTGEEFIVYEKPKMISFLPEDFRFVKLTLPVDLPSGSYSALTIIDIDPHLDLQVGLLDFEH